MSRAKARTLLAKFHALSNAAEFIRSHGEEGFSFNDDDFNKIYLREVKKLTKKLDKQSQSYIDQYNDLAINIDDSVTENY